MFEVLIVDDEPLARQSLRYLIDWESHGFKITAEAEDGLQALEMIRQRHFSLVLTDIRMPTMNGLELIERMRGFSEASAIILSGYDDFDYARQGIKLGVQGYLLKPVDEDDLIAELRKAGEEIAEKERFTRQHRLGVGALRDVYLRKLAHGQMNGRELAEGAQLADMCMRKGSLCFLLVELDFVSDASKGDSEWNIDLKRFAVRNILEELFSRMGYVFEESDERLGIVLFAAEPGQLAEDQWVRQAELLMKSVRTYAKVSVTIGIGTAVPDVAEANLSFTTAEEALDGKFLRGSGTILTRIRYDQQEYRGLGDEAFSAGHDFNGDELLDALRSCDRLRVEQAIAAIHNKAVESDLPASLLRMEILGLLVQLYQLVKQSGADPDSLFHYRLGDYETVMRAKTAEELFGFMQDKCAAVLALVLQTQDLQPNRVTAAVMKIVQEQYSSNISLRHVAQQVYLNPNYLGKLFKLNTNLSFNDYLLQIRMEKAKELLLRSDHKVYEIALMVGYGELDWFYKRFKAYTGVSAGEFRSKPGK